MNILVINASPKGESSNTYKLTRAFIEGIESKFSSTPEEELSIDTIALNSTNIGFCRGCFACWNKTPGKYLLSSAKYHPVYPPTRHRINTNHI